MIKHAWLLFLFLSSVCMFMSCSNGKTQRIKYQVYKNDRLMFVAYHQVSESLPEADLWRELHKKIYFTPIDGKPSVVPSNTLFNRNPNSKSEGDITILILNGDEILSHTAMEHVAFKPTKDQKFWILADGQAGEIVNKATLATPMEDKLNHEATSTLGIDDSTETVDEETDTSNESLNN